MVTTKSNYEEDLETILNDLNLNCNNSCTINQTHSNKIFHAKKGKFYGNGDGLIADSFFPNSDGKFTGVKAGQIIRRN